MKVLKLTKDLFYSRPAPTIEYSHLVLITPKSFHILIGLQKVLQASDRKNSICVKASILGSTEQKVVQKLSKKYKIYPQKPFKEPNINSEATFGTQVWTSKVENGEHRRCKQIQIRSAFSCEAARMMIHVNTY